MLVEKLVLTWYQLQEVQTQIRILVSKLKTCISHVINMFYIYLVNPVFKIKMENSELRTSVGHQITLMIALPDIHRPTITWKKDGQPVNHPVLSDGSLYIVNTIFSDQGRYIVTVSSEGSTESATLLLKVINPQMPSGTINIANTTTGYWTL